MSSRGRKAPGSKPVLDLGRPDDDRNREREVQPKLVAKHRHGVSGVTIMLAVGVRHLVARMWLVRLLVMVVGRVIHADSNHYSTATTAPGEDRSGWGPDQLLYTLRALEFERDPADI